MKNKVKLSQPRYDVTGRYLALLEAGEIVLCEGYDNAQPQLIAKTAGVSVGLFYRHFKNKQELLTAIMVHHLGILHRQIALDVEQYSNPADALHAVIVLTLCYFQAHQGLIKLFFMQIGYGDVTATEKLGVARQTYRNILTSILQDGIAQSIFLAADVLDIETAVNCIIGTINWSLYDLLVVKNENIEPNKLAKKLSAHLLRSLLR